MLLLVRLASHTRAHTVGAGVSFGWARRDLVIPRGAAVHRPSRRLAGPFRPLQLGGVSPRGRGGAPPTLEDQALLGPGSRAAGQPPWNAAGVRPAFLGRRCRIRVVDLGDHAEPAGRAEGSNLCPGQAPSSNAYPVAFQGPWAGFGDGCLVRLAERRRADCSGVQASCRPVGTRHSSVSLRRWPALAGAWPSGAVEGPSSMHV